MKAFTILSIPLLVSAAAVENILSKRQLGGIGDIFGLSLSSGSKAPVTTQKTEAKIDNGAIRERILWGPYKLQPGNATHPSAGRALKLDPNSDIFSSRVTGLCKDCMVLYAQADLAWKNGTKADIGGGVYSHHILMVDIGHPMVDMPIISRCADGSRGGFDFGKQGSIGGGRDRGYGGSFGGKRPNLSVFIGQGDEGSAMTYSTKNSKLKSGFWISKTDQLNMMAEVINYDQFEKDIYVSLDYEYLPNFQSRPKEYYDVGFGSINVTPCGSSMLHPPADGPVKYASPIWKVTDDGYIMDIKPHLHDGGLNMTFFVNDKPACSSKAIYGGLTGGLNIGSEKWETITAYTPCIDPVAIKKGDNLTMEAYYDLTQHRLRPTNNDHMESAEGMALALFTYAKPSV